MKIRKKFDLIKLMQLISLIWLIASPEEQEKKHGFYAQGTLIF
jgi:hypothetical protein